MLASEVMTPSPLTVSRDTEVAEVARLILERRVSAVPVVGENGSLVGLVSASDLLEREDLGTAPALRWLVQKIWPHTAAKHYLKTRGNRAEHVMSRQTVTIRQEAELTEVIRLMVERGVQRVIVVDEQSRPVGIVTRRDVLRAMLAERTGDAEVGRDEAIRTELAAELGRQAWFNPARVSFTVQHGLVTLDGVAHSAEEKQAICLAAERAAGATDRVRDRLLLET